MGIASWVLGWLATVCRADIQVLGIRAAPREGMVAIHLVELQSLAALKRPASDAFQRGNSPFPFLE